MLTHMQAQAHTQYTCIIVYYSTVLALTRVIGDGGMAHVDGGKWSWGLK